MPRKQKYGNIITGKYKSKLESTCATLLKEHGIKFEYEPWEVVLLDPFSSKLNSYERTGKTFKNVRAVRKISYKPDFVGKGYVIETKGRKTPDFSIKWKLFKKFLEDNDLNFTLFMPTTKGEILKSIEIIKTL